MIRFPEVIETARLAELGMQGYAYELSRMHPNNGTKQIITASSSGALIEPVVETLQVSNVTWTLSVMPVKGWGDPAGLALRAALGLLFSVLLGYVAKLLVESKAHAKGLEALVVERTAEVAAREARFRTLADMSSDFYWETDAGHRLTHHGSAGNKASTVSGFERGTQIGEHRWDIPFLHRRMGWQAHLAVLDAHQPFRFRTRAQVDGNCAIS